MEIAIPDFCLPVVYSDLSIGEICKRDLRGKWTVLYFYPKDNTPGCTIEAKEFSLLYDKFKKLDVRVYGVSKDSIDSHKKFIQKHNLKIPLISDEELILIKSLGVWQKKKRFGKETYGVVRSTFIVNPKVDVVWYKYNVKAKGHAEEVYNIMKDLVKSKNDDKK